MRSPVPDVLPESSCVATSEGASELALDLYRQLADARRETRTALERAEQQIETHVVGVSATIAALAGERFEFDRLLKRIEPELTALGAGNVARVLDLFARAWNSTLSREGVEVRDLTGLAFTDELAEAADVSSAIEDPSIGEPIVGETLVPLVLYRGRVVGKALVNKMVPLNSAVSGDRTESGV